MIRLRVYDHPVTRSRLHSGKLVCGILLLLLASGTGAETRTFTFGVVPQFDARRINEIWLPILTEIEKKTGYKFRLKGSPTIPAFETQFLVGEFDFAYMNPYHALKAAEKQQYVPMVRDIARQLYGIVVVRKDSGISSVKELNNKLVAFPAPNSLGASLMPRSDFANKFQISVQPRYVQSHSSVYLNVALGRTTAGGGVQKTLLRQKNSIKEKLKIIYKTSSFSPHPVVAHGRISQKVREEITRAFLEIGETNSGRMMLEKIPVMKIGHAKLQDYKPIEDFNLDKYIVKEK